MPYKHKEEQAASAKRHYIKNKEKISIRAKIYSKFVRIRNRDFKNEYLSNHPCIDCGNSDIRVLDFDHVSGIKKRDICKLHRSCVSLQTIIDEIDKCEVRCANCHRIVTYERRLNAR